MGFPQGYAPLFLSSCFSFGFGVMTPEYICRVARQRGYQALGLVDRHNFYGLVRFLRAADSEEIQPIVGMTLLSGTVPVCSAYVLDRRGFRRLNQMVSRPRGDDPVEDLLHRGRDGLAVMSADPSVLRTLLKGGSRDLYVQLTYGGPLRDLLSLSRTTGLPPLAVNQAVFVEPQQARLGDLMRSISRRSLLEDLPAPDRLRDEMRLVETPEMERFFSAVPEALDQAAELAARCRADELLSREPVFPRYRELTEEQSFRLLRRLCAQGAQRRYAGGPGAVAGWRERLTHELGVIRRKGFAGYFLVVRDILRGCSRTCGRGSSAASVVSYLLGITQVDPLRYNLDFDRFLNDKRQDPPDIDVDFPWDERDGVLRRLFGRYRGRAALVADHVTFGPRSAMREAATAFGLPEREIDKMVKLFKSARQDHIPSYLLEAARGLLGLPRHLGTHCGGVVITPEPITDYTHVQRSRLGYPVMAWDRDSAEGARLVKIDLLGNRSLAVLRDTVRLVHHRRDRGRSGAVGGRLLSLLESRGSPEQLTPLQDGATRRMIAAGNTLGLFYIESPATRQLLRKMERGDYQHLIMAGSIIRPAANATIRRFLQRLHGQSYRCPTPVLEQSYGLMIYQEDIGRVTAAAAGFDPAEAERLRKDLAGKNGSVDLKTWRRRFFSAGTLAGSSQASLEELWKMISSFRGYSFCKAHSASYALVSLKLAYLKKHFPLEFFLSVINNGGGYYSRQTYLNECRRLGIRLLLPDVNHSDILFSAEEGGIRVGLGQLRGISRRFVGGLLNQRRRQGPFADSPDFFRRVKPGLMETRILVRSGALDGIAGGAPRPRLLWRYLRGEEDLIASRLPPLADYPEELKLLDELRTLGLMISRHPASLFRPRAVRLAVSLGMPPLIRSSRIAERTGREVSLLGLVASGKEVITRSRASMVFVSLDDEFSLFETVLFPSVFQRYRDCLDGGGVLLLSGRVERDRGAHSITVRRIARIRDHTTP